MAMSRRRSASPSTKKSNAGDSHADSDVSGDGAAEAVQQAEEDGLELVRSSRNTTGYLGVCRHSQLGGFAAHCLGQYLGMFPSAEEAALAVARACESTRVFPHRVRAVNEDNREP